jgi:pyridoxal phosphate enzyme (YggS family)
VSAIADNLATVRAAIAVAATAAGRDAAEVTLIAVSKGHDAAAVREAYACGQRDFGENYVQEWQDKAGALADLPEINWHFLGHLQRNKIRSVIGRVALLHSADDMAGIDEMQRAAWSQNCKQDVLLQINLAEEAQKRGCGEDDAELFLDVLLRSPNLRLRGLMTLPPADENPEVTREWFQRLRILRDRALGRMRGKPGAPSHLWLSMGMSGDYPLAIAEGATHVRVGTAIFGARSPKNR